jgi:phosphatidylserine/phosphatidylglycerophosphate/cardiolipin synthase-like enzyme
MITLLIEISASRSGDMVVFVTSANLTEAALERNIELGLLVRDRALAATVTCHFQGLIDRALLCPLPID